MIVVRKKLTFMQCVIAVIILDELKESFQRKLDDVIIISIDKLIIE